MAVHLKRRIETAVTEEMDHNVRGASRALKVGCGQRSRYLSSYANSGTPIYDTIATAVWASLRTVGVQPERVKGWGRLFGEVK